MARNTSFSLRKHFEDFVESSVNNGRYKNMSEVIRAGLRLLEEEENKSTNFKKAIKLGLSNGLAVDFNPKKHLTMLKSGRKKHG